MARNYRHVHIDEEEWGYIIGSRFLSIRNPQGRRKVVSKAEADYPETPQQVKDYIVKNLELFTNL